MRSNPHIDQDAANPDPDSAGKTRGIGSHLQTHHYNFYCNNYNHNYFYNYYNYHTYYNYNYRVATKG